MIYELGNAKVKELCGYGFGFLYDCMKDGGGKEIIHTYSSFDERTGNFHIVPASKGTVLSFAKQVDEMIDKIKVNKDFLDSVGNYNLMCVKSGRYRNDWLKHEGYIAITDENGLILWKEETSTMQRKLPIGIQGFEKLRTENFLYVDKTEYIYQLVHNNVPYFLSRPRRFGKSLLLSALKAYWEGKKELFSGLVIEKAEADNPDAWKPYPVFYFDFNGKNYQSDGALEEQLDGHLRGWEAEYGADQKELALEERFRRLLGTAHRTTGCRVVILIDEYDKPLLETMSEPNLQEHNKALFKGFLVRLKVKMSISSLSLSRE